jgi:hypothetical protein
LRENFDGFNFAIHKEKEMADFRRWILAFAALVLVIGSVAPASAQSNSLVCSSAAAVTPDLRHESLDDLVGDIVLTCVGGTGAVPTASGAPIPQGNFQVNLSLPFTSRLLSGNISEALLLVDDPSPANQTVCSNPNNPAVVCQDYGTSPAGGTFNAAGRFNVFQGINSSIPGQQGLVTFRRTDRSAGFRGSPAAHVSHHQHSCQRVGRRASADRVCFHLGQQQHFGGYQPRAAGCGRG